MYEGRFVCVSDVVVVNWCDLQLCLRLLYCVRRIEEHLEIVGTSVVTPGSLIAWYVWECVCVWPSGDLRKRLVL